MKSRAEINSRYAKAYAKARKRDKSEILDQVVEVTGWSRDNATRRLTGAARRPLGSGQQVVKLVRKSRGSKYSYDAVKALQRVWAGQGRTSMNPAALKSPSKASASRTLSRRMSAKLVASTKE